MTTSTRQPPAEVPPTPPSPAESANPYDAVPYSVNAFPQTTPNRLAAIAALFGLDAPSPDRCRVLELGCAAGGNIIPMALIHPRSHFVGIDLSHRQIADGQNTIRQLALTNIELHPLSILDVTPDLAGNPKDAKFDYILAHGVYSWVPPDVQDKILDICRTHLSPTGVAYISYNCYPGWHARGAIREMLWYHTEHLADPAERVRQARLFLAFLAQSIPPQATAYTAMVLQELSLLLRTPDTYLLHEHLEEYNEPLYFHQFAGRAMEKQLQFLAEAQLGAMVAGRLGAETEKTLRALSPDLLHMEQYMDFLRNRMFRQTLLCHAAVPLEHALRPDAVTRFHIASPLQPEARDPDLASDKTESFTTPGRAKLATSDPLMKAALTILGNLWPQPLPFATLIHQARSKVADAAANPPIQNPPIANAQSENQTSETANDPSLTLAKRLLHCYAEQLVEFSLSPPAFTTLLSDRPLASPYVRLRAATSEKITNLRLESITLSDASRLILTHLDGHHDKSALTALLVDHLAKHPAPQSPEPPAAAPPSSDTAPAPAQSKIENPTPECTTPHDRAATYINQLLPLFAKTALLIA